MLDNGMDNYVSDAMLIDIIHILRCCYAYVDNVV
jgi:hypothetical protein